MKLADHPLWLVGFRPFFTLACLAGVVLPLVWAVLFTGEWHHAPALAPVQWHAHEMFFGFGWAVMGGFLLTSTKNWVNVRGYHGAPLIALVAAWLVERYALWAGADWPRPLFLLAGNLFLLAIVAMLAATLVVHRKTDSYKDNAIFLVVLPLFLIAKNLLLDAGTFALGVTMTLGLFRMAFLVMLERTVTAFMKGAFQVTLPRHAALDMPIKGLGLVLVAAGWLPPPLVAAVALALAALLLARFVLWQPRLGLSRIDVGVMYLGYLAIVAQLLLEALAVIHPVAWVGTVSVHTFTFGAMGLIIPAMLVRICQGHTGRKVVFTRADKAVLWVMIAGFVLRVAAPQFYPAAYGHWIHLAALCWAVAFAVLAWRFVPLLFRPRIDGREH
ncbi:NnrS family protein [Oryzomicrobium sp.]|uniref:NnrS family protein n=1 Tax=Oryzomicrobium sp. TaxID=1911578 RepID=UPI0025CCE004|nr:NnrS family protein [Oryzomicrobium sp.]MCE1244078.1 NnrS family protein [Oryzomicrobium sp.]